MDILRKVFGEKHEKDLTKLTLEEIKMLSDARAPERERRRLRTKKIVDRNRLGGSRAK